MGQDGKARQQRACAVLLVLPPWPVAACALVGDLRPGIWSSAALGGSRATSELRKYPVRNIGNCCCVGLVLLGSLVARILAASSRGPWFTLCAPAHLAGCLPLVRKPREDSAVVSGLGSRLAL